MFMASATTTATIKFLQTPTSDAWVKQAIANLDTILLDHAQCERKAAGVALSLLSRYPSDKDLVTTLATIAQEELDHFQQVNQWLERRGIPLGPLPPPPYGSRLRQQVRQEEPYRRLDLLLVSALIEARSHERLGLLAHHCPEPDLAAFYYGLMASESRHYGVYWVLATRDFPTAQVTDRLQQLAAVESAILADPFPHPRIHS
jgi:tRNA-(ms[2]io[6]A)-hydroxylase